MAAFEFSTYEAFFADVLAQHEQDRGYRTRLAKAAGVHPSYITRIANGSAALTPDQAVALAEFWGLSENEKEYFLWLVLKGRAGDPSLRQMAQKKLNALKKEHEELGASLPAEKINPDVENEYYLSWIYAAIHLLTTLRNPLGLDQMARRLGLPEITVKSALGLLKKLGLVELDDRGLARATKKNIHLSNQSWMASVQHRNWRTLALERIGRPGGADLHYTGVHSLSRQDLERLRTLIREFLLQTDQLIRPSPEETACCFCLDLFEF